jgi:opacity protein-like surface antigen
MRRFLVTSVVLVGLALPAIAQDAEVGKEYNIIIQTEQTNQYTGAYGEAKVGSIAFDVPNAKKDEKYHVKVTDIKSNQYTGNKQASCEFQQQGGGERKGTCIAAP